jgi:hypothetical protein
MNRARIYGSEQKCQAAVSRYLTRTRELVDQVEGAQVRIATATGLTAESDAMGIEMEWERDILRWVTQTRRTMKKYLQGQLETVLPSLVSGPPSTTTGRLRRITLDDSVPWLLAVEREFLELHAVLGARRNVSETTATTASFVELHASGLVEESLIDDRAAEMCANRTPKQLARAIGSAKELTEATLRGALDQLNEQDTSNDDLVSLSRKWRNAIRTKAPPDPKGADALDKSQAALAGLVTFLAEWRNAYGTGHGRPRYPPGLAARHARLAVDAAETYVRFVVTTMDDLRLLPP